MEITGNIADSARIKAAFQRAPREFFLPAEAKGRAGIDAPLPIGFGQTNSQPSTVAFMLGLLTPQPGERVLDIGCGSGWTTALLSWLVSPGGVVIGLELIGELAFMAGRNCTPARLPQDVQTRIIEKDGRAGFPEEAPFDIILVSAAAREVPPKLPGQLKAGGRLLIPLGPPGGSQKLALITRDIDGRFTRKEYPGFIFVPLV